MTTTIALFLLVAAIQEGDPLPEMLIQARIRTMQLREMKMVWEAEMNKQQIEMGREVGNFVEGMKEGLKIEDLEDDSENIVIEDLHPGIPELLKDEVEAEAEAAWRSQEEEARVALRAQKIAEEGGLNGGRESSEEEADKKISPKKLFLIVKKLFLKKIFPQITFSITQLFPKKI